MSTKDGLPDSGLIFQLEAHCMSDSIRLLIIFILVTRVQRVVEASANKHQAKRIRLIQYYGTSRGAAPRCSMEQQRGLVVTTESTTILFLTLIESS